MRFFALGILSSLTLVLTACPDGDKEPTTSVTATVTMPSGPTTDDMTTTVTDGEVTTGGTETSGMTGTGTGTPTTGTPTTGDQTTGTPGTTTMPDTTGTVDTTGMPPDTTGGTTGGGGGGDYGACSNAMGMEMPCEDMTAVCLDDNNAQGLNGSFCSPECSGPGNICPKPAGLDPSVQAICAFDTNMDMEPDICALICNLDNDKCPDGMVCDDVGIPEMMGMKFGICAHQ